MSSTRGRGIGRGRENKPSSLRKAGWIRTPEIDEKPPVQKPELTVNVASESGPKQLAHDVGTYNVLLRAVNNPVFIPKTFQHPERLNPARAQISLSRLASAINAPEFVLGNGFTRHKETAEERLQVIEHFVNNKIRQLTEDPGLLDELSISMANYLSVCIRVENDMIKLSDLLFEKCVSQQNFQYIGSKLANHLDKCLVPKTTEQLQFRTVFLKRCSSEISRFNDVIHTNPERACNFAIFLGELLMNYKTIEGETIAKFLTVVSNIIKQLLLCHDRKLLICAGKLLKLTGSSLNQTDELFDTVTRLASDPRVDRTAQMLFSRVCELRRRSWGQHEIPQTPTYTQPNPYAAQGYSMYIPNIDGMLEEQAPDLPVFVDEEWNEYATDNSSQDGNQDDVELNEEFFRKMCLEQYGNYVPFATEDSWLSGQDDHYDAELAAFVKKGQRHCQSKHGRRNIKGIETESNAVIEVGKRLTATQKESAQGVVEAVRAEQAHAKKKKRRKKRKQVSPSAPTDPFDQCSFTTMEGLKVSWKYGNIAQERADILVSSAVPNLNNPTKVGRELNSVGGPSFMTACSKYTNVGTGDIQTTIGGNLQCNYVIHAVCCDWNSSGEAEKTLRSLFPKILLECARCSARSVAMPLIGTGKHRFPEDVVLRVMREEFEKFSSMYLPGTLKEIKLVRFDQSMRQTVPAQPVSGSELSLPSNWTPQPENQLVQLVRIETSSQEYLEVFKHFVAQGGNANQLYKVERIQNPQLYLRYLVFKKSMRGQVNELRLFHGTNAANIDSINAQNFSRSFAGVNGVAYGNGVYFARDASYSMGYANRQLPDSLPKMYMAKVLVGDYTKGETGMKAPPLKNDPYNPGLRYDSVVDHCSNPSMYIIFQDNQYYPEYLLTMQ